MKGIIRNVTLVEGYQGQGQDKKCLIAKDDGGTVTVYVKEAAKQIFKEAEPGRQVLLMPKNSGNGFLIKAVMPSGAVQTAPAAKKSLLEELEGQELQNAVDKAVMVWLMAYKGAYKKTKGDKELSKSAADAAVQILK